MGYSKNVISKIVANNAISASYAVNAANAIKGSGSFSGSFIGFLFGTSSWAYSSSQAISSSYAITASYALNGGGGGGPAFPYTGSAEITGSLGITGSFYISQSLTYFSSIDSTAPGDNNIFSLNTGSYRSAFGKYTLYSSSNARAGEFVTVWNNTTVRYFDNSTTDVGDTSNIVLSSSISSGQIFIQTSGGTGWTVRMLTTFI